MKSKFVVITIFLCLSETARATWSCFDFTSQSPRYNSLFCKNDDPNDNFSFVRIAYDRLNGLSLTVGGEPRYLDLAYSGFNAFIEEKNRNLRVPIQISYEHTGWEFWCNCMSSCLLPMSRVFASEAIQELTRDMRLYGNKNIMVRFHNKLASNNGITIIEYLDKFDNNRINELPKILSIWRKFPSLQN